MIRSRFYRMPEKSKREVHPQAREYFEKGIAALRKDNLDYATKLFEQSLKREPGFFECREALRLNQFKRSEKKGSFFKIFGKTTSSSLLPKGQLALRKNPIEAIEVAEQILNEDPYSVMGNKLLGEAATLAEFPKTALFAWELVMKQQPGDKSNTINYADALVNVGQLTKADEVINELAKAHPEDLDVLQYSKNMTARVTMAEGGYDKVTAGEADYRAVLKNEAEAVLLEQENRRSEQESTADTLINEYEGRLKDDPENLKLIRSLAELYNRKNDFDRSIEYYERFNKTNLRSDSAVDRAIVQTKLRRFDAQIEEAEGEAAEKLTEERKAFEIGQIQHLSDTYPSDLSLRFELGVLQFEAGDVQSAIRSFQRAQGNPHKEIAALTYLGQCFSKRGMNDMAARTLQNALDKKEVMDDEKMDLYYQLGCVLETMDKKEESIEQFKQIYERDIGYKDVADRVDAYYMSLG
jgi:tetratricopeptide (TPR) repeat protein